MTTVVVKRAPRRPAPEIPTGDLMVAAPPPLPATPAPRWQQLLQLLPMLTGAGATALLFAGRDGGAYAYLLGAVFGVSTLGMLVTSRGTAGGPRRVQTASVRQDYLRHLAALRRAARQAARSQRVGLLYRHPEPAQLWSVVDTDRLWERRPDDPDFAVVRVGLGPQTLATPLVPPVTGPADELEPMSAAALRRFLDTHSVVPDLPVAVALRGFARVHVRPGAGDDARALVRAVIAQLVVLHTAADVLIAVCVAQARRAEWDWVKWLPHAWHPTRHDAAGPVRLVACAAAELERLLAEVLAGRPRFAPGTGPVPHVVIILDGGDRDGTGQLGRDGGPAGVTVIDLDGPPVRLDRSMIVLDPAGTGGVLATVDGAGAGLGRPDRLARVAAEALARRLTAVRVAPGQDVEAAGGRDPGLDQLIGLDDPAGFDPPRLWSARRPGDRLRVPIGVGPDGQPVELDLKESARHGMGPHGLLVGATGSGKSELLRTLVLGLAMTHSPEALNFVLIDFKGGATFATLDRLPHVAAVITNLARELPLVERMTDALNGELVRRQELLRRAGNHTSVDGYEQARSAGSKLAPLPTLLIVCDEFAELLTAKPDFIELFLQIGRVGRSLGVHLLLASQRLEEGRLRGLETHLSYRIGLRTFSALESRSVLGVADAYQLPGAPGHGYLKAGTDRLIRFKAAQVSRGYRVRRPPAAPGYPRVLAFDTRTAPVPEPEPVPNPAAAATTAAAAAESLLDTVVARLAGHPAAAHQVWLPPLGAAPSLDELLGPVGPVPGRGLTVADPRLHAALRVPVALVDKPYEQRRELLWLDLDGSAGHLAVVGGPVSGKSSALRTLLTALALTHTPAEAQAYCLDFGGGLLAGVRGLPHVGGVATRLDPAAVRRTVAELVTLLTERERCFAVAGVESMAGYRATRSGWGAGGPVDGATTAGGARYADVFLVVDGWSTVRAEYEDLEPVLTDLATRGLSYGIHLVASATRWGDFRPGLRDLFGSRLELRLGDPGESAISRKAADNVPARSPGRGLTAAGLHLLTARPALAGGEPADLVKAVAAHWAGPAAPAVRLLPASVAYATVAAAAPATHPLAVPVGLAEADLSPAVLDFAADPHAVVFGDSGCGKSSFLRTLVRAITGRLGPERARLVLIDYRRGLLDAAEGEHVIGYASAAGPARELVEAVAGQLGARLPGPDVTAEQVRDRSWWQGPECFVLVDDYDLVAASDNPLLPLLGQLAQARDIGLHLVLTRRSGGAGRALYDPVLQRLRELSTPGVVMAGDRDEGPLLGGVRPGPLPPGRGWLVAGRDGARLVQLALAEPA